MSKDTALAGLRKGWALSQVEIAALLGVSPDTVARYENGERCPGLVAALGFELLYGKPLTALFPEHLFSIASHLLAGLAELSVEIEDAGGETSEKKQNFVAEVADRIEQLVPGI